MKYFISLVIVVVALTAEGNFLKPGRSEMDLDNRVVIITGATGTIGKGTCRRLAQVGMRVIIAALV